MKEKKESFLKSLFRDAYFYYALYMISLVVFIVQISNIFCFFAGIKLESINIDLSIIISIVSFILCIIFRVLSYKNIR